MNGNNKELENAMRVAIKDYDLRNVSDDVLLLCLRIIETNEFNYEFELSENGKLKLLHNMCSFCERTHAEMADVIKMSFNKKDDRYQELFQYSTQTTIDNVMCWGCPLPDCIGNVLGKLLILKKNNLLEEKLRERKNSVGFFKFEFHLKNGLRLVHEDIFQIANHLVKNNLVWVYPFLNKNGNNEVSILTPYTCEQLSQIQKIDDIQNIEISKEHTDWFLTQFDPQKSDELLCEHVECKQKYCPILVAGYMYYLIHSGQGHIIQEDRELYQEHKNEMLRQQIEKTFKDVGLNDISDDVLKFCLQIFNHPKFRYAFELDTTHDRLRVCTNLVPKKLCHKTFNEMVDFFSNRFSPDEIDSYLIEERSGCLSFTIFNKTCQDCHFSKCPYKVLGQKRHHPFGWCLFWWRQQDSNL